MKFQTAFVSETGLAFDAAQSRPAFFDFGRIDVEPLAVNAAEFFDLFVQKAGQDNAAALFGTHGKHFAEYTQRVGQNVGDNDIKLTLRQAVRQVELSVDVVCAALPLLARIACSSISTPMAEPAPSLRAAMAKMPEPQP